MGVWGRIDVAKQIHWATVIDDAGQVLLDRRVPNDPVAIAELVADLDAQIRLLAGRRRELVAEQTRRLARLHDLLASVHPGLERAVDLTTKGGLWLVSRYVTPAELRAAGRAGLIAHLAGAGGLPSGHQATLADHALAAAAAQQITVPAEHLIAELARELAAEALACRQRIARLDDDLGKLLDRHPDAALIRSLPGMGATLTAEFIAQAGTLAGFGSADQLAMAAGLAPVLRRPARPATSAAPPAATRTSSECSTSRHSARLPRQTAAPSTPASAGKANATIKP